MFWLVYFPAKMMEAERNIQWDCDRLSFLPSLQPSVLPPLPPPPNPRSLFFSTPPTQYTTFMLQYSFVFFTNHPQVHAPKHLPASISSAACSKVTPHSVCWLCRAQSSEWRPRSPSIPGCTMMQGTVGWVNTSFGTLLVRNGARMTSGWQAMAISLIELASFISNTYICMQSGRKLRIGYWGEGGGSRCRGLALEVWDIFLFYLSSVNNKIQICRWLLLALPWLGLSPL